MRPLISSIDAEYRRDQALGKQAMGQLGDTELSAPGPKRRQLDRRDGLASLREPRIALHGLAVRGETPRRTEHGDAPG